jgi:hypothetical protein
MDGALHLIAKLDGEATARQVALSEEYDWHPEGGYVRPALADRMIPRINLTSMPGIGAWEMVSSTGDANRWKVVAKGSATLATARVHDAIGGLLESSGHWTRIGAARASDATASDWDVPGIGGERWKGRLEVEPAGAGQFTARLNLARAAAAKP